MEISPDGIVEYLAAHGTHLSVQGQELLDVSLFEQAGIDSVGILGLIHFLEEHYEVVFDADDLDPDNFRTIGSVLAMVQARKSQSS